MTERVIATYPKDNPFSRRYVVEMEWRGQWFYFDAFRTKFFANRTARRRADLKVLGYRVVDTRASER